MLSLVSFYFVKPHRPMRIIFNSRKTVITGLAMIRYIIVKLTNGVALGYTAYSVIHTAMFKIYLAKTVRTITPKLTSTYNLH